MLWNRCGSFLATFFLDPGFIFPIFLRGGRVEYFPACTMPLACTSPLQVSPAIMRNKESARDYIEHAARVRELFDFSPIIPTPVGLSIQGETERKRET